HAVQARNHPSATQDGGLRWPSNRRSSSAGLARQLPSQRALRGSSRQNVPLNPDPPRESKVSMMSQSAHGTPTAGKADLFIAGEWVHSSDGGVRESINPADGTIVAAVDEATPADAGRAVAAARAAFDDGPWGAVGAAGRAALLCRIADLLVRDKEPLARLETADTGKTLVESRVDIDDVVSVFRYYADLLT